ncbi:hypothetical protein AB1046_17620 [Promicromonospora sp. Populi]|uniref:hypothetical protein n=1 Tax=Promicromonospora sp. Populi TaxID=3239420 RepID=UPI0034E2B506
MSTDRLTGSLCSTDKYRGLPWTDENPSAAARARMFGVCVSCPVAAACGREVTTKETTAGFWAGADRTMWREVSVSGLFDELLTGLPVQGTLPLDLPGLDTSEEAA